MAGWTGLEPAASAVTGRRYNQLNYYPAKSNSLKCSRETEYRDTSVSVQDFFWAHFSLFRGQIADLRGS